ncbi:MAG: hypothetical protein GY841_15815 [FCB group bacterium]|nr:hypothetical protein [FCB group bacterium]
MFLKQIKCVETGRKTSIFKSQDEDFIELSEDLEDAINRVIRRTYPGEYGDWSSCNSWEPGDTTITVTRARSVGGMREMNPADTMSFEITYK